MVNIKVGQKFKIFARNLKEKENLREKETEIAI